MSNTIGQKYQCFIDGDISYGRLVSIKNENSFHLKLQDGTDKIVSEDYLNSQCVKATPDAIMHIMIVDEPEFDGEVPKDVYICVADMMNVYNKSEIPSMIIRQNIYSKFKNLFSQSMMEVYVGDCLTVKNSSQEELTEFMTFTEINKHLTVVLYLDDDVKTINELVPNKFRKEIEVALKEIKESMPMALGCSDTFEQLLEDNNFIINFRSLFNIVSLDFPIILDKKNYDERKDIILNAKQHGLLEEVLGRRISNVAIVKYDKDIDVAKLVEVTHSVVCDSNSDIFLITYDIDGYIQNDSMDADILRSMGII